MRRFSWQRGLTRGVKEFLELQLPGLASEPRWEFDEEKPPLEYAIAAFTVGGIAWAIKIETPAQRGPLGWISIIRGPEKAYAGPIDVVTWNEIGRIIRAHSHIGAPA
jgi:hypothetical protein